MRKIKYILLLFPILLLVGCKQTPDLSFEQRGIAYDISDPALKQVVTRYLESNLVTPNFGGTVFCFFAGVKQVPQGDILNIYILSTNCQEYKNSEVLDPGSGRVGPVALQVQQKSNGYIVLDHQTPGDGSLYMPDYKRIFPKEFLFSKNSKVLAEFQTMLQRMEQETQAEVQKYFSSLQTYRNEKLGFEFNYPSNLKLQQENDMVVLNHTIPYENHGDCDMIGDGKTYPTLTDFNLSFELIARTVTPDFTDGEHTSGDLKGSWVYEGAEGCGEVVYYFPVEENKTLVVRKAAVQALSGISTQWDREEILKVPGVIRPEESEKLLNQILTSFKFINS